MSYDTLDSALVGRTSEKEENKTRYEQECPPDANVCQTESVADWVARGEHLYAIRRYFVSPFHLFILFRSCAKKKEEKACETGTGAANFRDCIVQCEGDNCNNDNTEIFKKTTATNKINSCNICSYIQKPDGSVEGNPSCGSQIGLGDMRISVLYSVWSKSGNIETLSASPFSLRYNRKVSRKIEGKKRHRDKLITPPAKGLTSKL